MLRICSSNLGVFAYPPETSTRFGGICKNPQIERPYIVHLVEGRVGILEQELTWLDRQITAVTDC